MNEECETSLASLLSVVPRDDLLRLIARRGRVGVDAFLAALHFDLDSAIERLEASAHRYQDDNEEKLTNFLSVQLAASGYDATCETNARGHTDLKIENKSAQIVWIAKAKLHATHEENIEGMLQLLTRYTSGRHPHAGFLLYIRQPRASLILEQWRAEVKSAQQLACTVVTDGACPSVFCLIMFIYLALRYAFATMVCFWHTSR